MINPVAPLLSISTTLDLSAAQVGEVTCAGVGLLLMAVGGWFGGRLIYEFGVAVKKTRPSLIR